MWKSQGLFPLCVVPYMFLLPVQCIEHSERLFLCRKLKAIYRCQPGRLWVSFSLLILLLVSFQVVEKLQPSRYVPGRMVNLHLILRAFTGSQYRPKAALLNSTQQRPP